MNREKYWTTIIIIFSAAFALGVLAGIAGDNKEMFLFLRLAGFVAHWVVVVKRVDDIGWSWVGYLYGIVPLGWIIVGFIPTGWANRKAQECTS